MSDANALPCSEQVLGRVQWVAEAIQGSAAGDGLLLLQEAALVLKATRAPTSLNVEDVVFVLHTRSTLPKHALVFGHVFAFLLFTEGSGTFPLRRRRRDQQQIEDKMEDTQAQQKQSTAKSYVAKEDLVWQGKWLKMKEVHWVQSFSCLLLHAPKPLICLPPPQRWTRWARATCGSPSSGLTTAKPPSMVHPLSHAPSVGNHQSPDCGLVAVVVQPLR